MTSKCQPYIEEMSEGVDSPKHLTKQQFGQRVYEAMLERGWNQSELARQADLPRDSISVYIRGRSLPSALNLQKLAKALDVEPSDLLPSRTMNPIDHDFPSIQLQVSTRSPDTAFLRINRIVPLKTAIRVVSMLEGLDETTSEPD